MPRTLPPELSDRLIDFLFDDLPSLKNCALVCRDWHVASHFHLFDTIRLNLSTDPARLTEIASSPPLRYSVKNVSVNSPLQDVSVVPYLFVVQNPTSTPAYAASQPTEVVTSRWYPSTSALLTRFTSITTLTFHNCALGPQRLYLRFLAGFPHLSHLTLYRCNVSYPPEHIVNEDIILPANVDTLGLVSLNLAEVTGEDIRLLIEWLLSTRTKKTIRRVKFWDVHPYAADYHEAMRMLLETTGVVLEELTISYLAFQDGVATIRSSLYPADALSVTPTKNLRTLCLLDGALGISELLVALAQVDSHCLEELHLQFTSLRSVGQDGRSSFWTSLGNMLSQPPYSNTQLVLWCGPLHEWASPSGCQVLEADTMQWLPERQSRGLIKVLNWDPVEVLWRGSLCNLEAKGNANLGVKRWRVLQASCSERTFELVTPGALSNQDFTQLRRLASIRYPMFVTRTLGAAVAREIPALRHVIMLPQGHPFKSGRVQSFLKAEKEPK
ncbi:hypothetical protein OBBRIDRAFT_808564 [Obba rivulosa]|uniref:F-box domain-containing protein n=1 Tax=Obba rivulosa TaxID=1052685 RepID=A0A8E2ALF9_9APHY|nr:hypothetical protein OBBRIDRAFT_808564 [Obba rivulosa]